MKIIGAHWTPKRNILEIQCSCGGVIQHPADRWWVACALCQRRENLAAIRERFARDNCQVPKEN